jgi:predicted DCC family thiol-disulfide oxidoreductase YuxK
MKTDRQHPVLLFDGVCNLCNGLVRFILKRDPAGHFRFASLQSASGQAILERFGRSRSELDTFLWAHGGVCRDKSTAGLLTLKGLGWPWNLLYALMLVPGPWRDWAYDRIARNRYRLFGRRETCSLPLPEYRDRFLP